MWSTDPRLSVRPDGETQALARTIAEVPHQIIVLGEHPLQPFLNQVAPVYRATW